MTDTPARFLTSREVAAVLHLDEKTVRRKAIRGEIRAVRIGGPRSPLRFPIDAVDEWQATRLKASA